MRLAGRISNWNDNKGFGFVIPHGGGEKAFVHIKSFQVGSRRPVDGDLISYMTVKDGRGRVNAMEVRFAGQKIEERKTPKRIPRAAIGIGFLVATVAVTALGFVPAVVPIVYFLMSCFSYIAYTLDKASAGKNYRRTPEDTLHVLDFLSGWPGALVAQQQVRHKTVKASFQKVFWLTVVANLVLVAVLIRIGWAAKATTLILGG